MGSFSGKLQRLRGFFIVYILARFAIDIILGWDIIRDVLGKKYFYRSKLVFFSPGALLVLIIFFTGVILALGLWVFYNLLRKKNWARIVLLVIGWLAVADAILSLLITARFSGLFSWLIQHAPDLDWQQLLLIDRLKDILGLIFWGYLIFVLQFDRRVKEDFFSPANKETESGLNKLDQN